MRVAWCFDNFFFFWISGGNMGFYRGSSCVRDDEMKDVGVFKDINKGEIVDSN